MDATGRKVRRLPGSPPKDPFTASVWYDLPEDKPKGWLKFLHNKAHTAETPVRDQLLASGDVAIERQKKLGSCPPTGSPWCTRTWCTPCRTGCARPFSTVLPPRT
ncbi:GPP34 family phosphoprotein [Streptomyces sp. M10(2022)]